MSIDHHKLPRQPYFGRQERSPVHDEREATQRVCAPSVVLDGAGLAERLSRTQV